MAKHVNVVKMLDDAVKMQAKLDKYHDGIAKEFNLTEEDIEDLANENYSLGLAITYLEGASSCLSQLIAEISKLK